jgi:DNA replication initiation complex subunit (GINS family)
MYDDLYNAWVKENSKVSLQKLPKDFYKGIINYIGRIRQEGRMLDRKSPKAKLISRELSNSKKLVEELINLRLEKSVRQIMSKKTLGNEQLSQEEQSILLGLKRSSEIFHSFLKEALRGKVTEIKNPEQRNRVVLRFLKETPAIAGADLKVYGPFSVEDVATLPTENAQVLVKHGVAMEIEAK